MKATIGRLLCASTLLVISSIQSTHAGSEDLLVETPDKGCMNHHEPMQHMHGFSDAPIGVMGDHVHHAGQFMFSYRYMFMRMEQNYLGDNVVADSQIITPQSAGGEGFLITPTRMETQMHMFGGMYSPTDQLTLMVMVPYTLKHMTHLVRNGNVFSTSSNGFGDVKLVPMFKFFASGSNSIHAQFGFSVPTGSLNNTDTTPNGVQRLPYPMQLGSGTFDLLPGFTYNGSSGVFSWGAQTTGVVRLGENSEDYRLGHRFNALAWGAVGLGDYLSATFRTTYSLWGNIAGADGELAPLSTTVPTADTEARGGQRIDLSIGLNIEMPGRFLRHNRIAVEAGRPVYQDLDGPQLGSDWFLVAGWQWLF